MKTMKNLILGLGLLTFSLMNAQSERMKNMIKVGVNGGIALPSTNATANAGVDVAYQNLVAPGFGLGIATGYNHFFGKDNDGIKNNDFGIVPVAGLIHIYPGKTGFYIGSDIGYGFLVGDKKVASNSDVDRPDGGFYIKPEAGWHNRNWNFSVQYTKLFTGNKGEIGSQDYNAASLGVGVSYNLPLGK